MPDRLGTGIRATCALPGSTDRVWRCSVAGPSRDAFGSGR